MSSRDVNTSTATEALASRYRHLFVLPSSPTLLLYGVAASLAFAILSRGAAWGVPFFFTLAVFVLSAAAISSALGMIDKKSIASFRRVLAALIVAEALWLALAAIGSAYAWFVGSPRPITNAIVYGAFVSAGLEFLVINGAFSKSESVSLSLAAIHPASTLIVIRFGEIAGGFDIVAAVFGAVSLVVIVSFLFLLKRKKTSHGHDSLSLFRAFMKTWTAGYPDELENIIADHSELVEITTKVMRFRTKSGDLFLVFPGVHPGPFHPVGSYDLPGVVSREFKDLGPVMTLHRPGGHERNLATRDDTARYAAEVKKLAQSIPPEGQPRLLRGPVRVKVGNAKASASAFSDDMIMTVSFAPLGSDDLDTGFEKALSIPASESGFDLSIVDAHNSIAPDLATPIIDDPGWAKLFGQVQESEAQPFKAAFAHSNEIGFEGRGDITENGIGLLMIQSVRKSVLILADANNSVPTLRAQVEDALVSEGYDLIELCTSDSHNLAARGLTVERGYEALGETTPTSSIASLAVKLAKLAEPRLAAAGFDSVRANTQVRVFGAKSLGEFATITQTSSRFSRNYFRFALVSVAVMFSLSIIF